MQDNRLHRRSRVAAVLLACLSASSLIFPDCASADGIYPDISGYTQDPIADLPLFRLPDKDGIWFATAFGTTCAMGEDGSYGCSGKLVGAKDGVNEIAWSPGDSNPRMYHTDNPRFDSGRWQQILIQQHAFTYRGSTCASTREAEVYCINGDNQDSQFLVGSLGTYRGRNPIS